MMVQVRLARVVPEVRQRAKVFAFCINSLRLTEFSLVVDFRILYIPFLWSIY